MKWKAMAVIAGVLLVVKTWHSVYSVYKENGRLTGENSSLSQSLSEQEAINTNQQARIMHLAEQAAKRLQELTNAKSQIDRLSDDLRTDTRRVYVKAECPKAETASPAGVDGSRPARLAKDAEQDYVRLLGELETLESQFLGLRDWANTECPLR
ncbi:putative endopeptidase (Protein gp15) [Xenorhabdus bovienii str. puntauvense]|uniref:Putative endopeptidase (Protein gp15) n=1 Tax=Xenorhabdus bovienii str. puntauvense TaxID=1398201 RepID=A0A077NEQ3_XENBV|nr:lysis protein [Xenorhabdus bovienii]CDG97334.1 putative endopeptidase (Protein gp15) [Xenorhabdus bovienii str. puntauvense]